MDKEKRISRIRKILFSAAAVIIALMIISGPGCGNQWMLFYNKPITGHVVDADTGKPIEGVIVIGMWRLSQFLSQGFGGYAKIILVKTDSDGKFKIPFWVAFKPWKINSAMHDLAPEIVIYKPGYKLYFSHKIERQGFPRDISKTQEQKQWLKEYYSLTPAKLRRVYTDGERLKNYDEFSSGADFPGSYYSKKQARVIFDALDEELSHLTDKNEFDTKQLIISSKKLREFWIGGSK